MNVEGGGEEKNEVHLTSISSPQPVKNCFFFGLSTPYRLCQSQKGHKEPLRVPPCVAATSAPPLPSPHLPSWGAKITLKRPASLCRLSSCHLRKKKEKRERQGRPESWRKEIPSGLTLFKFARAAKKKKKKDGGVADPSTPPPQPWWDGDLSLRNPERVRRPAMLTRLRAKTKMLEEAAESGNPERFLKPGKFGIISEIHLGKRPVTFKRTNQMCCYQFTAVATA